MLKEAVVYQDILQHGVRIGRQETQQEWLERGQEIVLRMLTQRFGRLAPKLRMQVKLLSLKKLEILFESLLKFENKSAFETWLNEATVKIK